MLRRRARPVILVVLAGLVINVLVATACILWSRPDQKAVRPPSESTQAYLMDLWAKHRPSMAPAAYPGGSMGEQRAIGLDVFFIRNGHPRDQHSLYWLRAGWPLRTLEGGRWRHMLLAPDPSIEGAMMITGGGGMEVQSVLLRADDSAFLGLSRPRIAPVGIAWTGLAVNALFYALPLGGLAWLLAAARRRRRRARGQCPDCGYPSGPSPICTECGAASSPAPNA